jgi:hypothetical protein
MGSADLTDIEFGKNGESITLRLNGIYQYLNGKWTIMPSKYYINNDWVEIKTRLTIWDGTNFSTGYE